MVLITRGNGGRPFQGIDTSLLSSIPLEWMFRGNGGRPFQGIDTFNAVHDVTEVIIVEMEVAPFRALTHLY